MRKFSPEAMIVITGLTDPETSLVNSRRQEKRL